MNTKSILFKLAVLMATILLFAACRGGASQEELTAAAQAGAQAVLDVQATAKASTPADEEPVEDAFTCVGNLNGDFYSVEKGDRALDGYELYCNPDAQILTSNDGETGECNGTYDDGYYTYYINPGDTWKVNGLTFDCPAVEVEEETVAEEAETAAEAVEGDSTGDEYQNTLGFGIGIIGEPGVRTADAGDPNCKEKESCWHINPDVQSKLSNTDEETIDCDEDGYTMVTTAGGTFSINGEVVLDLPAIEDTARLILFKCLEDGPGDNNTQIVVTNFNGSFTLETNLPPGERLSNRIMEAD